jgi:hypothetical protein
MKTKNLSFNEILKIINPYYGIKHRFLKLVLEYEIDTGHLREGMYYNIFKDGDISWSINPLFESREQVKKYIETGEL